MLPTLKDLATSCLKLKLRKYPQKQWQPLYFFSFSFFKKKTFHGVKTSEALTNPTCSAEDFN
jgi:hypothetical protein